MVRVLAELFGEQLRALKSFGRLGAVVATSCDDGRDEGQGRERLVGQRDGVRERFQSPETEREHAGGAEPEERRHDDHAGPH